MTHYNDFLNTKTPQVIPTGIPGIKASDLNPRLAGWQADLVANSLQLGRSALFEDCGLGKTFQELEWARIVYEETRQNVLILAPLAVAAQTVREGEKFGIPVKYCQEQSEVEPGITITNYERLHAFDPSKFVGVALDESSILKSFMGKTKRALVEAFRGHRFKLEGTATPAPNDVMELGNHCEFLGVMDSHEMLTRWFINDTMAAGNYRLKGHAEEDFWLWVASWASCVSKPSDLLRADGTPYSNAGYDLPGLEIIEHIVEAGGIAKPGELFHDGKLTATSIHQEMRQTAPARAEVARDLVNAQPGEQWTLWCNANYEADALTALIPEAIEVRGDDSMAEKERKLGLFSAGIARIIITKPSICGFGLNWQQCARTAFVGLSYSFEQFYQALRRSYRFGQKRLVEAHIAGARSEQGVRATIERKRGDHARMQERMALAMRQARQQRRELDEYEPRVRMAIPNWLSVGGQQ